MSELEKESFIAQTSSLRKNQNDDDDDVDAAVTEAEMTAATIATITTTTTTIPIDTVKANHFRTTTERRDLRWSGGSRSNSNNCNSASALQRCRTLQEAHDAVRRKEEDQLKAMLTKKRKIPFRDKIKNGVQKVGDVLQKVNIGKWIDELERDQEIADELNRQNIDNEEENERKQIVREAQEACMDAIRVHLHSFLLDDSENISTYEDWIAELHPDNIITTITNKNEDSNKQTEQQQFSIDPRYYLTDSDHRIMWNDAISKMDQHQQIKEHDDTHCNLHTKQSPNSGIVSSRIVEAKSLHEQVASRKDNNVN
jgi:hypothetical protein